MANKSVVKTLTQEKYLKQYCTWLVACIQQLVAWVTIQDSNSSLCAVRYQHAYSFLTVSSSLPISVSLAFICILSTLSLYSNLWWDFHDLSVDGFWIWKPCRSQRCKYKYRNVKWWLWLHFLEVKVTQWYPTLCNPMDYTVHGMLQARILEWVAVPFSRGSSQPRNQTQVSCVAGGFFTIGATREAQEY